MESSNSSSINKKWCANYQLAGVVVSITTVYQELHLVCADYRTEKEEEVSVVTSEEEIRQEAIRNDDEVGNFPSSYIETLLVYRKIAMKFLERGILLMHGSAIAVDGQGFLFTALSGTGKSTHTRLWRELLGDKAVMINDDKPLVRVGEDAEVPIIYGTPWDGKHHLSNNIAVPLKAIIYLERGDHNEMHPVSVSDIFPILLQQTFRENDMQTTSKVLRLLSRLSEKVKFFDLHCNMEFEAAKVSYVALGELL